METLRKQFQTHISKRLQKELEISNSYRVPKLEKIIVNAGFGRLVSGDDKKEQRDHIVKNIMTFVSLITGQHPSARGARKSVSSFKLRSGDIIGVCATLRGKRMYDFVERLIHIVFPRVRDFRGIAAHSVDAHGILTVGIKEHEAFPETMAEDFGRSYGVGITFVPTTRKREYALALYRALGILFKHEK